jgi:MEMO1 family protein
MGLFDKLLGRKREPNLRAPRFAGVLYPADAEVLRARVDELLAAAGGGGGGATRAMIIPQGDYSVAGDAMAGGWAQLRPVADRIERVVLVGSSRLVPFRGLAVTGFEGFETPLGPVVIDVDAVQRLVGLDQVRAIEPAFDPEASLEVQLPFVQVVLGDVAVVPLLVGDTNDEDLQEVIAPFLGDAAALVVVSANLSHDVGPERAAALDDELRVAVEALTVEPIGREHSLARMAIRGLVGAAAGHGLTAEMLARSSSADAPDTPAEPVTGFGVFVFCDAGEEG